MLNNRSLGLILILIAIIIFTAYIQYNTAPEFEADFSVFTSEELEWLKDHPVISYAPVSIFYPYEYYKDGEYHGLSIDYIDWIERNYGLVIDIVHYEAWADILEAIVNKEVDLITSTARSSQREAFISFSDPYVFMDFVAFIRTDQDDDFFEYDLINMKTAVIKNYISQDILEERHPGIDLILVEDSDEGFTRLSKGEIDVFVSSSGQALRSIEALDITNVKVNENVRILSSTPLSMGTYKGNEPLMTIMSKILENMPLEKKNEIYDKWMHIDFTDTFTPTLYKRVLIISVVVSFAIVLIFVWNQLLKIRVEARSEEIRSELHQRILLESQLKNIINAIPSPIYVKNAEGTYIHVNQKFCDLVGIASPSDIEYKVNLNTGVLTDSSRKQFAEMEDYVLRSGSPYRDKANQIEFLNGKSMILDSVKLPFRVLGSASEGILSVDIDITDRIRAKNELKAANEVLEDKVKERSEAIEQLNQELTVAMEQIQKNELDLQNTNAELTALLSTLQETQKELIEKETIGAQGEKLNQVSKEITKPIRASLEKNNQTRATISSLISDIAQHSTSPGQMMTKLNEVKKALSDIHVWLQESSRVVETFKLISLVDHGLQPTRINMKLMLDTCYRQILNVVPEGNIICPDNLVLMASPNAFHQILSHLIRYASSFSMSFGVDEPLRLSIEAAVTSENLEIKLTQKTDEASTLTEDAHIDLGLQIIESILNHYFDGHLSKYVHEGSLCLEVTLPSLFIANPDVAGGGDLDA